MNLFDKTGNLPPLPGIFPDYAAPIVRNQPDGRELTMARWGMPSPVFALKGTKSDPGVTNVRNVKSPHWRRWLGVETRCVVPFTSFSENDTLPDGTHPHVGNWARLLPGRTTCASAELASPKPPFVEMSERFWTPPMRRRETQDGDEAEEENEDREGRVVDLSGHPVFR